MVVHLGSIIVFQNFLLFFEGLFLWIVNRAPSRMGRCCLMCSIKTVVATIEESREIGLFSYLEFAWEGSSLHPFGVLTTF